MEFCIKIITVFPLWLLFGCVIFGVMRKYGNFLFGTFALLTLFLSLQPALLFAALTDTSDDADSGAPSLELRSGTSLLKRVATKDVLPHYLDGDKESKTGWSHLSLFAVYVSNHVATPNFEQPECTQTIRGPPDNIVV